MPGGTFPYAPMQAAVKSEAFFADVPGWKKRPGERRAVANMPFMPYLFMKGRRTEHFFCS
jgi:hypothetical protein